MVGKLSIVIGRGVLMSQSSLAGSVMQYSKGFYGGEAFDSDWSSSPDVTE